MAGFPRSDHICKHIHAVCRLNVYSNTDLAFNEESIECILKAVGYTKRTTYNNLEHTREDAMSKLILVNFPNWTMQQYWSLYAEKYTPGFTNNILHMMCNETKSTPPSNSEQPVHTKIFL